MSSTFQQAKVLYELKRYDEAIKLLIKAHVEDPSNIEIYNLTAWSYYLTKRAAPGLKVASGALAIDPENISSLIVHSACASYLGHSKLAAKSIASAIALNPQYSFGHYHRAFQLIKVQKYHDALKSINMAITLEPHNPGYFALQSEIQQLLGKNSEAKTSVLNALRLNPEIVHGHMQHGKIMRREGELNASIESLMEALRNDPNDEDARLELLDTLRCKFRPYEWAHRLSYWANKFSYWPRMLFWTSPIFVVAFGLFLYSELFIAGQVSIARASLVVSLTYGAIFLCHLLLRQFSIPFLNGIVAFNPKTAFVISKDMRLIVKVSLILLVTGFILTALGLLTGLVLLSATGIPFLIVYGGIAYVYFLFDRKE